RAIPCVREHLLSQDLIYVGGGSLVSLIGVWKAHGIDEIMREAWEAGVVLCGLSAGALCWFEDSVTAYYEAPERVDGMGFLPWSFTAHYDTEPERRIAFHRHLCGGMRPGYAADDGVALHFRGLALHRVVSSRPTAGATALRWGPRGVLEERLEARYLGNVATSARESETIAAAAKPVTGGGPVAAAAPALV
ncbi:MAG: Type 1 glutamine amidotransferase-like domain-containing protein, partial [Actinomycetota bacterium]|nr:Type 1 glutamine amidotransferase-like domain-containing protein [Actinomycetota bacterium]